MTDADIKHELNDIRTKLNKVITGNVDLNKRRVVNAGPSIGAFDYVTKQEIAPLLAEKGKPSNVATSVVTSTGVPKIIVNNTGVNVYDENGTLVHSLSLVDVTA